MHRIVGLLVTVTTVVLFWGVGAGAAAAVPTALGLGLRLVDVPTAEVDNPRARSYIVDHVHPGAVIERRVEVSNGTREPVQVQLYPAAAAVTDDGFVGATGHAGNDLSDWVSVTPARPVVAPGAATTADVTVKVPGDAVRGERYGVVWAEVTVPPSGPGGVVQISRVGIRIYLSVGSGGAPRTDFAITALTAARTSAGVPEIQASVHNTGERALDLSGSLTLSKGPAGLSAGPVTVPARTTVAIGATRDVVIPLDPQLPDGPWMAKVTIASGTVHHSAQASVTFPAAENSAAAPVPVGEGFTTRQVLPLAAAALLVALIAGYLLWRRRRRRLAVR